MRWLVSGQGARGLCSLEAAEHFSGGVVRDEACSTPDLGGLWYGFGGTLGRVDRWGVGSVFGAPGGVGASVGCGRPWEVRSEQVGFSGLLAVSLMKEQLWWKESSGGGFFGPIVDFPFQYVLGFALLVD